MQNTNNESKILFSVDLEEFDVPEAYGHQLPLQTKLEVSMEGMRKVQALMDKYGITGTIFTTALLAKYYPGYIRELSSRHEIASHTFYHNSFKEEDLVMSRIVLSSIINREVRGIRMPLMQHINAAALVKAGYLYDSSLHPTWLPGRYNNMGSRRTVHRRGKLWILPASVTPVLRIPVCWLSLKNFPFGLYKYCCKIILRRDNYIVLYVHPWEFTDLSSYKLPGIIKRLDGDRLLARLDGLFAYFLREGYTFDTHRGFIETLSRKYCKTNQP